MKILIILSFLFSFSAMARSTAPVIIPSLEVKKGTVHQHFVRENQSYTMYIVKKNLVGDVVWKTKIFSKTDGQDTGLKKMTLESDGILVVDEWDKEYQIDPMSGALLRPATPVQY